MGICLKKKFDDGSMLSVWKITESEDEFKKIFSVPQSEIEELNFMKSPAKRKEKLAVGALLSDRFDEKVYLGHHDNGKPFLRNNVTEISISHSTGYAVLYTHPESCVGVDIESLSRDFSKVESRILSDDEIDDVSSRDDDKNEYLAAYWSAKEAVYKLMSQPSVDYASQIRIDKFTLKDEGDMDAVFVNRDGVEYEIRLEYMIFDDHILVWCKEDE